MDKIEVKEFHSSCLITPCMRSLYHRHKGDVIATMQTALFRGLVAHSVMEQIHMDGWQIGQVPARVEVAVQDTIEKSKEERRPLTDSVMANLEDIKDEVTKVCVHYVERQAEYFSQCKVIGVELPVRWTLEVGDLEPIDFASHIDLLYRNPSGELVVRDFKFQDEAPTMAYLARNQQFALYHFCIAEGIVKVHNTGTDGDWVAFGEQPWIDVVDLANFKPYARKTTVTDFETGGTKEYVKGDQRPLANLIKTWRFSPDKEDEMKRELSTRPVLMRAGIWPILADKRGCQLCESKHKCSNWIKDETPQ